MFLILADGERREMNVGFQRESSQKSKLRKLGKKLKDNIKCTCIFVKYVVKWEVDGTGYVHT
jgi:hypothetical protein